MPALRSEAFRWFVRGAGFALGVALIGGILLGVSLAGKVVLIVFLALLLASGLQPVIDWARWHAPLGRGATLLLVYALVLLAVVGLGLLVLPGAFNQFNDLGIRLLPVLAEARAWAQNIEPRALSISLTGLIDQLLRMLAAPVAEVPEPELLIDVGVAVAELSIMLAALLALVFFWLTERARLQRFALAMLPHERRTAARDAWNQIELRLGGWVRAQLILMGFVGVATTIAYLLIGLEGALLLGLIAALAEAVPIVGPIVGAIPALLVAAMTGRLEIVLLVAVVYVAIQVVESNVLVPVVMRNTIGIPPFIVLASILGGAAIGGIVGALLAVPLTAAVLVVAERLQARGSRVLLERQALASSSLEPDPTAGEELARSRGQPNE
jgi:predicted PurR-regulated permease PerM